MHTAKFKKRLRFFSKTFPPLLANGLLLVLVLYGLAFSLVSVFSLPVSRPALGAGCVVCALAALVIFSLPRLRWIPLLAAAGGWALLLWRRQDALSLGEIALRCAVVNTFAEYVPGVAPIMPIADLPAEVWTSAATLTALMVLIPAAVLAAWALVRLRSSALFFWFTFPFFLPVLTITALPDRLPLLALCAAWITAAVIALAVRRDRAGGERLTLLVLPCAGALLLAVTLALPADSYQRPQWADRARDRLTTWAAERFEGPLEGGGAGGGLNGASLADAGGGIDLAGAGPLRYTGRTVLNVEAELSGRIYLRGFSGAVYEGDRWAPLPEELCGDFFPMTYYGPDVPLYTSAVPDPVPFQPMNLPALLDREIHPEHDYVKVTIENVGADPGYVYYPYQILTTPEQLGGAAFVNDAYLARAEDVRTHTLYVMPECDPAQMSAPPDSLRQAEQRYRDFVYHYYTDVPGKLYETLQDHWMELFQDPEHNLPNGVENEHFQRLIYGDFKVYELEYAALIADYLSARTEYDPDTPATPEGVDFVTYFLNGSRRGYCMHYASAAVLMLRFSGIPARYVSGYVADMKGGRARVPDANAHAWVEVYRDGYGWEPVEVTPPYAGATPGRVEATPTPAPSAAPTPSAGPANRPAPSAAPTPTPAPVNKGGGLPKLLQGPRLLAWMGAAAAVLAVLLRRPVARRRRARRARGPDANQSVLFLYRCMVRLERWGTPMDPALLALAQKAAFSQHTLTEDERAQAIEALQRAAARTDAALPRWKRPLFRWIWGL